MKVAHAEVQTYTGVGEYVMGNNDTQNFAREQAKLLAEQSATEQAAVYIYSSSVVKDSNLVQNEITAITGGVIRIADVKYNSVSPEGGFVKFQATVTANIDIDSLNAEIEKWKKRTGQSRENIVEVNDDRQQTIDALRKRVAELEAQIANVKTEQDKQNIRTQISSID